MTPAFTTFGNKVIDAANPILIARIPVLHRCVFDFSIVQRHQLDHCRMQLIFITHRCGAAFEIGHISALISNNQRTLKLTGIHRIDTEIGRQLHRTTHTFRDVDKRAIGKHRRIQCGKEVITLRHYRTKILTYQFRVFAYRFGNRAEYHTRCFQPGFECCGHRHRIKHRIDSNVFNAGQKCLLAQGNAQLLVSFQQFRVDIIHGCRSITGFLRGGIIGNRLIIGRCIIHRRPARLLHRQPVTIGL